MVKQEIKKQEIKNEERDMGGHDFWTGTRLAVVDGRLQVTSTTTVTDELGEALRVHTDVLMMIVEVFGPVELAAVLPAEHSSTLAVFADQAPTVPCPVCTLPERPERLVASTTFTTGRWQVCLRCDGTTWRRTPSRDACATCSPLPDPLPSPGWYRAGDGWVCRVCHSPVPPTDLRDLARRTQRRTRLDDSRPRQRPLFEPDLRGLPHRA
jgi:hypothetical protein